MSETTPAFDALQVASLWAGATAFASIIVYVLVEGYRQSLRDKAGR